MNKKINKILKEGLETLKINFEDNDKFPVGKNMFDTLYQVLERAYFENASPLVAGFAKAKNGACLCEIEIGDGLINSCLYIDKSKTCYFQSKTKNNSQEEDDFGFIVSLFLCSRKEKQGSEAFEQFVFSLADNSEGYIKTNFQKATLKGFDELVLDTGFINGEEKSVDIKALKKLPTKKSFLASFETKDWTLPNLKISEEGAQRIKNNPLVEGYLPTLEDKKYVERIYNSINKNGIAPSFFFYGPAGTGKSEKGKYFSKMLGLPYSFICCSAMTTESDLRGKPQSLGTQGSLVKFFERVAKTFWNKSIETSDICSDKIQYSLTELVQACKEGWIIEIQEPTLIQNAGTLGFLNCVLDNNRTLILPDGEQIKIHPNTVFIFTTNLNYEGCNLLNNSLLSRIDYVKKINPPSISEQVNRLKKVTSYNGPESDLKKVIQAIEEIKKIIEENEVNQGISDFRTAINIVNDYKNNATSWREAAYYCLEDKCCLEPGFSEQIKLKLDFIFGEM